MPAIKKNYLMLVSVIGLFLLSSCGVHSHTGTRVVRNSLPSWNEGETRKSIIDFVERVTTAGNPGYVPVEERVAVFDNDGTLWSEQPMYVPLVFVVDRIRELASAHPEWKTSQPYQRVLDDGVSGISSLGEQGITELIEAAMGGMTTEQSDALVKSWILRARHPEKNRPYTEMVYLPMLELLDYLRAHDFKTYIVSGGSVDFMRVWTERVYGIPPEQVLGSFMDIKFEASSRGPVLSFFPQMSFYNNGPSKPVAIRQFIGRKPIFAAGNSDGDRQMLEYTKSTVEDRSRFAMIIHHTDNQREVAYDRQSRIGRLDKALDQAPGVGWTVVDMKRDWATVFASH